MRPYWKGYLKLSLVTCPVQMMPATSESEKVRFHTLNRETHNRVVSHYVDAVTGKEVKDEDEVKGYQRGENDYIILEDEELENVALDSTKTIDIDVFAPRDSIEWIWLDTPYYLSPNDPVGQEAFSVIRDAMAAEDMVGISRLVISRRERAVMLEPRGKGIVLWTLRYGDEVRDEDAYFSGIDDKPSDSEMMPLIQQLIKKQTRHWDSKLVADPVQDKLLEIIEAKRKKTKRPAKAKGFRTEGHAQQRHQHHGCSAQVRRGGEPSRQALEPACGDRPNRRSLLAKSEPRPVSSAAPARSAAARPAIRSDATADRTLPRAAEAERADGPDWLFEIKWDGYRLAVHIEPKDVRIITRGGHDWTHRFPAIAAAAKELERPHGNPRW